MNIEQIHDRIKKLLRLAKNAGSEHEAALAAQRASELLREHQIHEAEISLDAPDAPAPVAEAILRDVEAEATRGDRKANAWKFSVANGVTRLYNCRYFVYGGKKITLFGRESDVRACDYTMAYLCGEIERLCKAGAKAAGSPGLSWCHAFRLGAAQRVQDTLLGLAAGKLRERQTILARAGKPVTERTASGLKRRHTAVVRVAEVAQSSLGTELVPFRALATVAEREQDVDDAYEEQCHKFWGNRRGRSVRSSTARNASGYRAGREAGAGIQVGGAKAALGAGQGRLK